MDIRKLLNLQSDSEKIAEYKALLRRSMEISEKIDRLAEEFAEKSSLAKSVDIFEEDVKKRYNLFLEDHVKNVAAVQKEREQIYKSLAKLSKEPELAQLFDDIYNAFTLKCNVKKKKISKSVYNEFLKAKTGRVQYADVLLFRGNKLLILQRAGEYGASTDKWCVPGGHVDLGESFLEAAARELFEETGIEIPEDLLMEAAVAKGKDYEIHYFIGHIDDEYPVQVIVDSEEEVGSTWIDPSTELEDYDFIFDMKENLQRILGCEPKPSCVQEITKAFSEKKISYKVFEDFCKSHQEEIEKENNKPELSLIAKSYISEKERMKLEKEGKAMAGGRFPVRNRSDLRNAIKLVGNSDLPKAEVIAYLKRRAKELDATNELPESWSDKVEKTIDCDDVNTICKEHLDEEVKKHEGDGIEDKKEDVQKAIDEGLKGFRLSIDFNDLDQAEMFKALVDDLKKSGKLDIESIMVEDEDLAKAANPMYTVFSDYANFLEGVKTRSKNVHWGELDNSKHVYLDDLMDELSKYEDKIMEAGQSEFGRFKEGVIKGIDVSVNDPVSLIDLIIDQTHSFYNQIKDSESYVGEKSWIEDFLATLKQTKYRLQMH